MFAALNSYKSLHWYCQTCESAAVDAISRLNSDVSQETASDLSMLFKKIEEHFTRSIETVTSNLSKALNGTISHMTQVVKDVTKKVRYVIFP